MTKSPANYPDPIWTDESNDFAHDTMIRRVPETIRNIQARNPDLHDSMHKALEQLSHDISNDAPINMIDIHAPDYESWQPAFEARKGETWLNTQWFFAETYFYRQVMACVKWWATQVDPFTSYKNEEYSSAAHWALLDSALDLEGERDALLASAIQGALWGNRIDLSFEDSLKRGTTAKNEDLLVDDTYKAVACLTKSDSGAVHIITDNAGSELTMDLVLVDRIVQLTDLQVTIHVKMHPTFVSDAITDDIWLFIKLLKARGAIYVPFAERLEQAILSGRVRLVPHFFWNSGSFMWDMPKHLYDGFNGSQLVMIKGDANYRRIVGDAMWEADTPFSDVVSYFPAPFMALRTLKSDPIVGLPSGMATRLDGEDARWRLNGQRGVIQLKA